MSKGDRTDKKAERLAAAAAEEVFTESRERFELSFQDQGDIRRDAEDDLNFENGDQWDDKLRADREEDGRPCLTINKLPAFIDQVCGDQRQNRPQIQVIAVDSDGDPEVARILEGLIRNIENVSDAELAYDTAFECAISGGFGFFRVVTDYCADDSFEQEIRIERISNPMTVYWDPAATDLNLSDSRYLFVTRMLSREEFEHRWPKADLSDWKEAQEQAPNWFVGDTQIRVAEYWRKVSKQRTLYLVRDLRTGEEFKTEKDPGGDDPQFEVVRTRTVDTPRIECYLLSGVGVLEGPKEWAGKYFPVIPVWGKERNILGKRILRSLIRNAKDPQRVYNYFRSCHTETVALAPKSPFLATPRQMENFLEIWKNANKSNYSVLPYNPDPQAMGAPQRASPAQIPAGISEEVALAGSEIRDTIGLYEASLGMKGNETSGKAIIARQREGDTGTFAFIDNLARAKRQAGRVLVDLIPKIYDSPRMVRITGLDGDTEFVPVNHELSGLNPPAAEVEEQWPGYKGPMAVNAVTKILNDITVGKYDATVTVGPSYATQRQESADGMINFVRAVPQIGPMIAHVIAKNMDWPGSDEIAGILKKLLPPQLLEEDKGGAAGAGVVPGAPGGAVEPPPAPDPRLELMAAQMALKERELALKEVKTLTEAMASIAKAESMEAGTQIQIYKALVDQLLKQAQGGGAGTGGPGGPGIPGGPGGPGAPGRPEAQAQGMPSGLPGPGVPVSPGPGGPELPDYGIDRALPPELGGMPAY